MSCKKQTNKRNGKFSRRSCSARPEPIGSRLPAVPEPIG